MVAGVHTLLPGHLVRLSVDAATASEPEPYWQPPVDRDLDLGLAEAADQLRELFVASMRMHLRSDVAVGAALSGGLDSSAIALVARQLVPDADFHSFSYVADEPRYDEERWIDLVAGAAGATPHKVRASADALAAGLDDLVRSQGEPFVSTSMFAQRLVFAEARRRDVPVLLDGQGADELFGGYRSYFAGRMASLVRHGRVGAALRLSRSVITNPDMRVGAGAVRRMAAGIAPPSVRRRTARLLHREPFPAWLDEPWFDARGVSSTDLASEGASSGFEGQLLKAFARMSLPSLLRYEDRSSMAYAVESRVPFLTPALVDFVFRLPPDLLFGEDGTTKLVFREAMRGIVPDAVLDRRDKVGFNTPELSWYRALAPQIDDALADGRHRPAGLSLAACRERWVKVRDGHTVFDWVVWRWLNLQRWMDVFDVAS
jgi:asparagine synthase (glutamine-hydrolysing)